jgi:rhodanese-related sulfurtransferase
VLIDVREPWEHEQQRIPGAVLIPLREVHDRLAEIPEDRDVYVHCHVGARSAAAVEYLRAHGRPRAINVAGGIEAWLGAGLPVTG